MQRFRQQDEGSDRDRAGDQAGDEIDAAPAMGAEQRRADRRADHRADCESDMDAGEEEIAARLVGEFDDDHAQRRHRSEEQTSELPSIMSSSYAVFCLKK